MWKRIKRWLSDYGLSITLVGLILALVIAWLSPLIFIFIPPGHTGVYWVRFGDGTVTDRVLGEGVAYKLPWDKIYIYDARMQIRDGNFNVLTSDGLHVGIGMSIRYRLVRDDIGLLHKNIGPNYVNTLLFPEVNSHSRHEIGNYTPEELYSSKRTEIEDTITQRLKDAMHFEYQSEVDRESFLFIEYLMLKDIVLPDTVRRAIEDKQVQLHLMEGYDYRVQREEKERVRKRVEAQGIQEFQNIVSEGISEQYLKWKGINATLELATSNNAKVVVIGAGEGGLPIILGNIDSTPKAPSIVDGAPPILDQVPNMAEQKLFQPPGLQLTPPPASGMLKPLPTEKMGQPESGIISETEGSKAVLINPN